jgi:hypothetical protein
MIKSCVVTLCLLVALVSTGAGVQAQSSVDATGNWNMTPNGEALTSGMLRLRQDGSTVAGSYGQTGKIEGRFEPGTRQIDANWMDARGTGWMTIVFEADGNRFSGEWGRPGTRPSGYFVAVRAIHPSVTGVYNIHTTGGTDFTSNQISLHQLGLDVVGNYGPRTQLTGTMSTDSNTFNGTWKGASGTGWIKLQFADDSRSVVGSWGLAPGTDASGQFAGSTGSGGSTPSHTGSGVLGVRGLWHIASSGPAFTSDRLQLEQQGENVSGSFKDGHLEGTIPPGSHSLSGSWRDSHGSGIFTLRFASDGMSFKGTWTTKHNNAGSVIGKRVVAAMQAVRQ